MIPNYNSKIIIIFIICNTNYKLSTKIAAK